MREKTRSYVNNKTPRRLRKRKKSRSYAGILVLLLLLSAIGGFFAYEIVISPRDTFSQANFNPVPPGETLPIKTAASPSRQIIPVTELPEVSTFPQSLSIHSNNAVLMDFDQGAILFDKNGETRMYPASLTKILTAVVVLEQVDSLNEAVWLDKSIFPPLYTQGAAMAGFSQGEAVSVIDLLYGLLLPSGAECAVALAEHVAGSEAAFAVLMNDKAAELGMADSNFTNATGLHNDNHYSTASDIAVLFRYALENPVFYQAIISTRHTAQARSEITFYSTLLSKITTPEFNGGVLLGGKTGYTSQSGQCLASLALKDGHRYILVTSGAFGDSAAQDLHIEDAFAVYEKIGADG